LEECLDKLVCHLIFCNIIYYFNLGNLTMNDKRSKAKQTHQAR
jgi:hypothetical protein